jgi:hypothetical protein
MASWWLIGKFQLREMPVTRSRHNSTRQPLPGITEECQSIFKIYFG